jgi:tight adherence protein B
MDQGLLLIVVGVLGFIMVAGLGLVFAGAPSPNARMVKRAQALSTASAKVRQVVNDPAARRKQMLKTLRDKDRQQRRANVSLEGKLQQAGLTATIKHFWIASGITGLVVLVPAIVFGIKPLLAIGMGFAAAFGLPRWTLGFLVNRRMKKFTGAFSDAIDIIVRGIKSGLPLNDCLKIIGRECPEPLAGEFRRLIETMAMGVTVDMALEQMYERMPTQELRFFTIVLAIQQKAGGNLGEALGNLSAVLRSRKLMREKIKALSSEATASAMIIGSMPPAVILLITVTTPAYMAIMFNDPRGHMLLLGGALWMSLGIFVMRRMINFKF